MIDLSMSASLMAEMTRWAERYSAYQHFYQAYSFTVIVIEATALGPHWYNLSNNYSDATQLLFALSDMCYSYCNLKL